MSLLGLYHWEHWEPSHLQETCAVRNILDLSPLSLGVFTKLCDNHVIKGHLLSGKELEADVNRECLPNPNKSTNKIE